MNWQWLAGFFDGEGSVGIKTSTYKDTFYVSPCLQLKQAGDKGQRILQEIKLFLEEQRIKVNGPYFIKARQDSRVGHCQESYSLQLGDQESVSRFLKNLLPYLRVKKTEAQDLQRFFTLYSKKNRQKSKGQK